MSASSPSVAVLAGGVGGARLLGGLVQVVDDTQLTVVVNTGDDTVLHGLSISPDLDTITYSLAGAVNKDTGWGLEAESWAAMDALGRYGDGAWFRLGDKDLATHLHRTGRLAAGATLSEVTAEIGRAWGLAVRLLPMSDQPVRTRLLLADGRDVEFQEYFVRLAHSVPVASVRFEGIGSAKPAPGVLEAIGSADVVVLAPSNPVVSLGPILALEGIVPALLERRQDVVAVSPIVAGAALKGPAGRLLDELGGKSSAPGVARWLSQVVGTLVIDQADRALAGDVEAAGLACLVADTVMTTPQVAAGLARTVLSAAGTGRRR